MIVDLGILGEVKMEPLEAVHRVDKYKLVTHSGYTEQGIRVNLYSASNAGWGHGELWNNAIMLNYNIALIES